MESEELATGLQQVQALQEQENVVLGHLEIAPYDFSVALIAEELNKRTTTALLNINNDLNI